MSAVPDEVRKWLIERGYGRINKVRSVGGGCINQGMTLETENDGSFFLKRNDNAPPDMFKAEALGLEKLTVEGGPYIPGVYTFSSRYLLLENLHPRPPHAGYWEMLGDRLAVLHLHTAECFGFDQDNYIGSTPQPNSWIENGPRFFAEERLLFQARMAADRRLLPREDVRRIETIARRLSEWIPLQPASLLHGDLWRGNVITNARGEPALIDPAAHYGWAEAELAMTDLFGSFPSAFYLAYQNRRPLEHGFRDRYPIYNLYHLINHLNLFGSSYLAPVRSILKKYT